ncbi:hypothetical protein GWM83_05425, partial [Candidatus Bathyarchaeota archaeon]|nr:hypothetical protein [Candidatus Bathyarchaeota archaeon]NIV68279.1 hypothetical protein [Candidatus Bathyarchaeota archaeon]NIW34975.1 hypothetical protein [Candidatus Bathyarchaeota archaeon]
PEGIDQNELGDFHLVVAMKEEHKRHLLARHPQLSERIIVWDIDDPLFLPEGYDRKIMEEIKEKVSELSASL